MSTVAAPKKERKYFKTKLFLGLFAVIFIGDIAINDDWDTQLDKFRPNISDEERAKRPKVVILGTGWGALSVIRKMRADQFDVTVVSPRNYFLFTPLLPSTCAGAIDTRCIIEPIRDFCARANASSVKFFEAECTNIDSANNKIKCKRNSQNYYREISKKGIDEFELEYDYLVVACGTESATFGIPGVREHALFMKEAPDGKRLRGRIIDSLESANMPTGQKDLDRLLNFVVVGGGPTGVECAAELHDFVKQEVSQFFPHLKAKINITLIEAQSNVLSMFSKSLVDYTEEKFRRSAIDVKTRTLVTGVDDKDVTVKSLDTGELSKIPYGTLLWASGVASRPFVKDLMKKIGKENGQTSPRALVVDEKCRVKGSDNIFAIGDCAFMGLPPTAQVAGQQGKYLGRLLRNGGELMYQGKKSGNDEAFTNYLDDATAFGYNHMGAFAYLGDNSAIADFTNKNEDSKFGKSAGVGTYILWRSVYFTKLLSFRNRVLVTMNWGFTEIFGRDTSRR